MIAHKFLRSGRTGPFSGVLWPEPGTWLRAGEDLDACRRGIHACRLSDLPWWLSDELWEIELDGEVRAAEHKIVAPAGRLLSRVGGWTPECAQDYADACAWRARDRAVEALVRHSHDHAAATLAACATLDELLSHARALARALPDSRIDLTIVGDGAVRALSGAAPTSAYIAAHAALRVDGPAGYASERAWQTAWLVERLVLRNGANAARLV